MKQKLCKNPDCGLKNLDQFYHDRTRPDRRSYYCKTCDSARSKIKYEKTKPRCKERNKIAYRKCKRETMSHYGKVCQCCGESRLEFLTLDHINQDGAEHRRKMGFNSTCTGYGFYLWLRKNNWPNLGLQVLCANCNSAKGSCGVCPHMLENVLIDGAGI